MDLRVALGERIKEKRLERGLTQESLAYEAGLHPNFVSLVELGKRKISVESLLRLAFGLGCNASELLEGLNWQPEE